MNNNFKEKILGILNSPSGTMKLGLFVLNPLKVNFYPTISDLRFVQQLIREEEFSKIIAFVYLKLTDSKNFKLRKQLLKEFPVDITKIKLDRRSSLLKRRKKRKKK